MGVPDPDPQREGDTEENPAREVPLSVEQRGDEDAGRRKRTEQQSDWSADTTAPIQEPTLLHRSRGSAGLRSGGEDHPSFFG